MSSYLCSTTLAHQIAFQNTFPAARVPWHRRLRRSSPDTFRSEGRSEEALSAGAEPGIEVADFLAVRPEHRGNDDGALVEPERARFDER